MIFSDIFSKEWWLILYYCFWRERGSWEKIMGSAGCIIPAHLVCCSRLIMNSLKDKSYCEPEPKERLHTHQDKMHISIFCAGCGSLLSWFTMTTQPFTMVLWGWVPASRLPWKICLSAGWRPFTMHTRPELNNHLSMSKQAFNPG